jgi:hypothetical protein
MMIQTVLPRAQAPVPKLLSNLPEARGLNEPNEASPCGTTYLWQSLLYALQIE